MASFIGGSPNARRNKFYLRALYIFGQVILCVGCSSGLVEVTIRNDSGSVLNTVDVVACQKTFSFTSIANSSYVSLSHKATCESEYAVHINYSDGRYLDRKVGYITRGVDLKNTITVARDSVDFSMTLELESGTN